jgi:hypothetical protein
MAQGRGGCWSSCSGKTAARPGQEAARVARGNAREGSGCLDGDGRAWRSSSAVALKAHSGGQGGDNGARAREVRGDGLL